MKCGVCLNNAREARRSRAVRVLFLCQPTHVVVFPSATDAAKIVRSSNSRSIACMSYEYLLRWF